MKKDYYEMLSKIFKRHYKDIKDEKYLEDERNFKVELSHEFHEILSEKEMKLLLEEEEYREILTRYRTFFNKTRLMNWRDFNILRKHQMSLRPTLCQGLYDLLFSKESVEERIDSFIEILNQEKDVTPSNKWSLISYILFFYYPRDHFFVKPSIWDEICNRLEIDNPREVNMTGASYQGILRACKEIITSLEGTDLQPRDMIDLHSIFTICFK